MNQPYRFIRVEEYFDSYQSWERLERVHSHSYLEDKQTLVLNFETASGSAAMLIQFLRPDILRLRFNPGKSKFEDYTEQNSRSIVMDTFEQLKEELGSLSLEFQDLNGDTPVIQLIAKKLSNQDEQSVPYLKLVVNREPFQLRIFKYELEGEDYLVWKTNEGGVYFAENGNEDFSIIQSVVKPPTAKYIGFGEQGGKSLVKNSEQVTFFNFDNMRYRQVYNTGPFEEREPLYHSDPFFMEFNGDPSHDSVYGIYIDNPSQVSIDIGYLNSSRYLFGTRFGDLDYYFLLGENFANVLGCHTAIVGRPKLKPRFVLGYHQGCYGYENRSDLEKTVADYRQFQIPIDGLHVDVDIQKNYQTFTIDDEKFNNPMEMFTNLRAQGIKCCTNITPIISNRDSNYTTFSNGLDKQYFVLDIRLDPNNTEGRSYQDISGGSDNYQEFQDPEVRFNSGQPYVGEVYYGGDPGRERGTTGHYADLSRKEVRIWWGEQYQFLFDLGLEFVWQDMTTPAIRNTRGDMRAFPFRLMVNSDLLSETQPSLSPAIKVWSLYSYNLHKATYHGLNYLKGRENKRNFIIGRGSFTGMHRFAGLWTGDNSSSWSFLQINVAQCLAIGLCGLAISGQDIGGFERENEWEQCADPELLIRWTAAGAFLPWFRNHYIRKGTKLFQEPYAYQWDRLPDWKWNLPEEKRRMFGSVMPICKHYIELRYRLMQLLYDAMFENVVHGLPICRPLFLNDPDDKTLFNDKVQFLDNEFFVGKDLLVAPILEPQSEANRWGCRDVYLPAGSNWYAFMDNRRRLLAPIEGGTTIADYDAHLDSSPEHIGFVMPLFVRQGAIIPTLEIEQYVGERNSKGLPNPITLNIYPGDSGEYTLYLDDGISRSSAPADLPQYKFNKNKEEENAKSEYRETLVSHDYQETKTRLISIDHKHKNYTPIFEKYFFVAILHEPSETLGSNGPVQSISVDGELLSALTLGDSQQAADALNIVPANSWYYNRDINITFIKVFDENQNISITIRYT
jgi:alpha-glucosidase